MGPFFVFGDMYQQNETLIGLLEPVITGLGYELWGVELLGSGAGTTLRIYIDSDDEAGIDVEDCQKVSRQITGVLDVEDPIKGHYVLEVSSPGMDRILFKAQQFNRYIGDIIKVQLHRKIDGRRRFKGRLTAVLQSAIELLEDDTAYTLPFQEIDMARLVPQFQSGPDKRV